MAGQAKKPKWAIERDRARKEAARGQGPTIWLFGLHAVRDALINPRRVRHRLIVTPNAATRLAEAIEASGIEPETADPRRFPAPLDPQSVHQGAALEAQPLDWGGLSELAQPRPGAPPPLLVLLDRVTDPHNVGAILRSAEVFGARAVVAPRHHSAPETGALAKAASGALERQPYLKVRNLGDAMQDLAALGYALIGLDGAAETDLADALVTAAEQPIALVLGAEGPGLRPRTRDCCTALARITPAAGFGSLNVSNAAAVALFAARNRA
ncbi:MAG: RNA methyltransferase [Paracoccaceae bacterium]|nr:RNA methyltransferase [Paracoccaceae bacterium]